MKRITYKSLSCLVFFIIFISSNIQAQISVATNECEDWRTKHPEWIFCDDFESSQPLVSDGRYFEANTSAGKFELLSSVGINSSAGMQSTWQVADVNTGDLKLGFGRNPVPGMNKGIRQSEDFREIYYRHFLKMQPGWQGNPYKLSRASVIAKNDWSQAMIAHIWQGSDKQLAIDPAGCVDASNQVKCIGYNDFSQLNFLGYKNGTTAIFETDQADQWLCIEARVKLNDPGQSNGIQEFWVNDNLEVSSTDLDFVKSYNDYAINTIFFENYWNSGSPQVQSRYFDNIVVSTERIGCTTKEAENSESETTASNTPETNVDNTTDNATSAENSGSGSFGFYSLLMLFILYRRKNTARII